MRGRDPTSRLAGPPVDQPGNRMTCDSRAADSIIIITFKGEVSCSLRGAESNGRGPRKLRRSLPT